MENKKNPEIFLDDKIFVCCSRDDYLSKMDGVGAELWALVHHMYVVKPSPAKALEELCLRSNEKFDAGDVGMAPSAREIVYTRWYGAMKSRFKLLREQLALSKKAGEIEEVVESLFPQGVAVGRLAEAFVSIAALLTSAIDDAVVADAAQARIGVYSAKRVAVVSAKDLTRDFVSGPLVTSLIPPLWWIPPSYSSASPSGPPSPSSAAKQASVTRIALLVTPPTIVLQYTKQGRMRKRSVHLSDAGFTQTTPISALIKKLRRSHGALISDDDIRRLLLQLQRLMKEAAADSTAVQTPAAATTSISTSVQAKAKPAVNKADLGLLYRDPEAALANVDLQDADDFTVKEFKARMNEKFEKNIVKPGDPGYAYDKRVIVKPTAKSEWDDDDD